MAFYVALMLIDVRAMHAAMPALKAGKIASVSSSNQLSRFALANKCSSEMVLLAWILIVAEFAQ